MPPPWSAWLAKMITIALNPRKSRRKVANVLVESKLIEEHQSFKFHVCFIQTILNLM